MQDQEDTPGQIHGTGGRGTATGSEHRAWPITAPRGNVGPFRGCVAAIISGNARFRSPDSPVRLATCFLTMQQDVGREDLWLRFIVGLSPV